MLADFRLILGRFLPIWADGWQMFGRFWLIFLEKIGLVTTFVGQKSVCEKTILEKKNGFGKPMLENIGVGKTYLVKTVFLNRFVLDRSWHNRSWSKSVLEKPILEKIFLGKKHFLFFLTPLPQPTSGFEGL